MQTKDEESNDQNPSQEPPRPKISAKTLLIGKASKSNIVQPAEQPVTEIDALLPLNIASFIHQPRKGSQQIPCTIANLDCMLKAYRITARYDVIKKRLRVDIPGQTGTPDNVENVSIAYIHSLAALNGMANGQIPAYLAVIGDRNPLNIVADWITGSPWDGQDRLPLIYDTLVTTSEYPKVLKEILMYRWLLSAVAAALKPSGFRARGVLTLLGPQGIGKTSWVHSLVPDPVLREIVVKLDLYLDPHIKDSILAAVTHWIVEIGELDSSFRKDIARLKGFLTNDRDKVRRPYARSESDYPRRTVFCATVNDHNYLVDRTGNSRWWTVPVIKVNFSHGIDTQQLFAQLKADYESGVQWWLSAEEERMLEAQNQNYRAISVIRDRVLDALDLKVKDREGMPALTPTELLRQIGIKNPTNPQSKECGAILRDLYGEPKRIQGQNKWRVPIKQTAWNPTTLDREDSDKY
jgi:predicted P-loop ATPase